MKSVRRFTILGCLAAALTGGLARAQVVTGRFNLPFETRWALATLPAGSYSFMLDHATANGTLVVYRGIKAVALIKSNGYNPIRDRVDRSALMVTRDPAGSGAVVTALTLASVGMVFSYPPHKRKRGTAPEEKQMAQIIPVGTAGK